MTGHSHSLSNGQVLFTGLNQIILWVQHALFTITVIFCCEAVKYWKLPTEDYFTAQLLLKTLGQ